MIILSGYLLAIPPRVLPLFSPLVSGHQASDALSLTYFKNIMKENEVQDGKLNGQLWTCNGAPVASLFQNKVMILQKIMLIYDEPLTERSTPIIKAATCRFPEGGLFNGGSTLCMINTIGRVGGGGGGNISFHMAGGKFGDWESSYDHHHLHTVTNIRHYQKINGYFHHCDIREKIQHLITKARHLGFRQELEIRLKPR